VKEVSTGPENNPVKRGPEEEGMVKYAPGEVHKKRRKLKGLRRPMGNPLTGEKKPRHPSRTGEGVTHFREYILKTQARGRLNRDVPC